jgi:tungstate transport system substrate-binding protein
MATVLIVSGTVIYFEYFATRRLIISTTTSLYDTGLLDVVEKTFEAKYPVDINLISAGTGIAIQHATKGDADVVLVHSPSQEKAFLISGVGVCRKIIAYNFFVIVGPASDPAKINGTTPLTALQRIVDYGRNQTDKVWVSRGDNSGTHTKEQDLWKKAGYTYATLTTESWYASAGSGMGATLMMANEKEAYTISDTGTYLAYSKDGRISLKQFISQAKDLLNVYSVMAVVPTTQANRTVHDQINFQDSIALIRFLVSDEGQQLIENYGKSQYGQSLFYPTVQALKQNSNEQVFQWIREYAYFNGTECPTAYRYGMEGLYS